MSESLSNAKISNISRRQFFQSVAVVSGGLALGATVGQSTKLSAGVLSNTNQSSDLELNLFITIDMQGQVSIICHRSEMGQGIRTGLPQIAADEMQADWTKVNVVQGMANEAYGSQNTDGSRSIRDFYTIMREMGATARTMLEQAAANRWQVELSQVSASNHQVTHKLSGESLSFGELAAEAAQLPTPDRKTLVLMSPADFKYIGKPVPIVDMDAMITGTAIFGQDVQIPNMLYATISRWPVVGAKLKAVDDSETLKVKGVVQTVTMPAQGRPVKFKAQPGVAVLANNSWAALKGRKLLQLEWKEGSNAEHNSVEFTKELVAKVQKRGSTARERGSYYLNIAKAADSIEATYTVPYLGHEPMEPPAATVWLHDGICEVWACVQTAQSTQKEVAKLLGMDVEDVQVNVTFLGGAFGRKSKPDFVLEAAYLAQQTGRPVKVFWTREDDIKHDYYHAISAQFYQAGLDEAGNVDAWLQRTSFPTIASTYTRLIWWPQSSELSMGFADMPFAMRHLQCESHSAGAHVRIGWMRSVANIHHAFGLGSFVDELAVKTGTKIIPMWRQLLGDQTAVDPNKEGLNYDNYGESLDDHPIDISRFKALLDHMETKVDLDETLPAGQGWGFSMHRSFASYVAVATKVEVADGAVKVLAMHGAMDAGLVINPDRVATQLEGGMIFGLSIALMGNMSVAQGRVEQSNFDDAPVTRMHQCPAMTVHIMPAPEGRLPGGVGEPGTPPVSASVTNAIFAASGQRIRDLPVNKVFTV